MVRRKFNREFKIAASKLVTERDESSRPSSVRSASSMFRTESPRASIATAGSFSASIRPLARYRIPERKGAARPAICGALNAIAPLRSGLSPSRGRRETGDVTTGCRVRSARGVPDRPDGARLRCRVRADIAGRGSGDGLARDRGRGSRTRPDPGAAAAKRNVLSQIPAQPGSRASYAVVK